MTSHIQYVESRSPRSVWVEILEWIKTSQNSKSRSPRSVWVEILRQFCICIIINVTLPTERVSWNNFFINRQQNCTASRSPRSVWVEICYIFVKKKLQIVTFPTERVSWNNLHLLQFAPFHSHAPHGACELKSILFFGRNNSAESRSPRSVWVEICYIFVKKKLHFVTLPTERVSWNFITIAHITFSACHAPHGACELKYKY